MTGTVTSGQVLRSRSSLLYLWILKYLRYNQAAPLRSARKEYIKHLLRANDDRVVSA